MPTQFKAIRFPGSIRRAFVDPLAAALRSIPSAQEEQPWLADRFDTVGPHNVELIGPFRLFFVSSLRLARSKSIGRSCTHIGWRSIFVHADKGLAVVDVGTTSKGAQVRQVHGDAVAHRHLESLSVLAELARVQRWKPGAHEIRVIEMPSVFTTAFWVPGGVFLPMRMGAHAPDHLSPLRPKAFVNAVAALRRVHHRRPVPTRHGTK